MPNDIPEVKRDPDWQARERDRRDDGTAKVPVWYNDLVMARFRYCEPGASHFVHVSPNDPKLLAYTQDADKGERNIQTPIKPGKYLTKYYSKELTEKQIRFYANWQLTGIKESAFDKAELHFADTQEGIVRVYRTGPQSCMVFRDRDVSDHPCRVYAAGDLAIAYLTLGGKIIARALVWPSKKVFGRVYPTECNWQTDGFSSMSESQDAKDTLTQRLRADGYDIDGSFNGARLLKIEDSSRTIMPYLDGDYGVNEGGDHWIMTDDGPEYCCGATGGTICTGEEEEEEEFDYHCEDCEDGLHGYETFSYYRRITPEGRVRGERTVCQSCYENNSFRCEGFDAQLSTNETSVEIGDCTYSKTYCEANFAYCDGSEVWFDPKTDARVDVDEETWCQSYFAVNGFTCLATGENRPNSEMHPDHDGVSNDASDAEIAEYLARQPTSETIPDVRQVTFTATWGDQTATLTY